MKNFFSTVLILIAIAAGLWGINAFAAAQSAIHEIEALICGLIVTVALGAGYVGAMVEKK